TLRHWSEHDGRFRVVKRQRCCGWIGASGLGAYSLSSHNRSVYSTGESGVVMVGVWLDSFHANGTVDEHMLRTGLITRWVSRIAGFLTRSVRSRPFNM